MINNKYPTTKPSLNLDFANTKSLDPRITFRRGTPGTYYDGVTHAKAEENLIDYSEQISQLGGARVTVNDNSSDSPQGSQTASQVIMNSEFGFHDAYIYSIKPQKNALTHSVYAKAGTGIPSVYFYSNDGGNRLAKFNLLTGEYIGHCGGQIYIPFDGYSIESVGNDWYRITATILEPQWWQASRNYIVGLSQDTDDTIEEASSGTDFCYLWGAQLEQRDSVTSYTATNGTPITKYQPQLMTAAADSARFDHDPLTGESKGLLIEESRTNLIAYSQQIEQQTSLSTNYNKWVVGIDAEGVPNVLVDLNQAIAPDGTLSASKFYSVADSKTPSLFQQVYDTDTNPETLTFSIFAKAGQANRYLQLFSGSGDVAGNPFANFNLFNGTISRDDSSIASIEDHGNGWYRCIITFTTTSTSGATINPVIYLIDDDNAARGPIMNGDGYSGIYIWGAQLETGSFPTSYIKTTGASATRSADNTSITGENFSSWYRQDEGSIYTEIISAKNIDIATGQCALSIGDGSTSNILRLRRSTSDRTVGMIKRVNGSNTAFASSTESLTDNTTGKLVGAYDLDASYVAFDGSSVLSASGASPLNLNKAIIGDSPFTAGDCLNGHIKKIAYYPQRLTNEQLQNLTK